MLSEGAGGWVGTNNIFFAEHLLSISIFIIANFDEKIKCLTNLSETGAQKQSVYTKLVFFPTSF
jgi:hypothetical protein